MADLITIYIDEQAYQADPSDNLLANVLSNKLNLPYFCWHPSMGSVGACRQCAVTQYADENDQQGRIVMSCMTPVTNGMRIGLKDGQSAEFREQVIAAMMTNHPHDCPVCAEGGECHLQDMTVMTGHSTRHYQGEKRTFTNQYLGDLVGHEMNRCITCYRCVRFYKDYAGGEDFGVFGSKNQVYFGRQSDGALESEFSGNLVEVCPTGVFTNKVFSSHYTRKWDLQSAPSICSHCSVGCNTSIGERYGSVRRVMNRYNNELNGYFLCDRGRFGIGFVNSELRINNVKGIPQQSPQGLSELDVNKALAHLRGKKLIGIGSGRASLEINAYLKAIVGDTAFSAGFTQNQMALAAEQLSILKQYSQASIQEIEQSDFVLIVGEDITQTSPRVALAVRQALNNKSLSKAEKIGIPKWQDDAVRTCGGGKLSPLYLLNQVDTKLDKVSKCVIREPVEQLIGWLTLLNDALNQSIETVCELLSQAQQTILTQLYQDLLAAKKPLIVTGWSTESPELMNAVSQLMDTLTSYTENIKSHSMSPKCVVLPPEANSVGLISLLDQQSLSVEQVIEHLERKDFEGILVTENSLTHCHKTQREQLLQYAGLVVVIDHSEHAISHHADIVMPAAAVSESNGCYVNYQGQVQPFHASLLPKLPILESWRWLTHFDGLINVDAGRSAHSNVKSLTELRQYLQGSFETLDFNVYEQASRLLARETKRASGRTAKTANQSVHEPKSAVVKDEHYSFSMEGEKGTSHADMPFVWSPSWNSNQAITQFQEHVNGELTNRREPIFINFSHCDVGPQKLDNTRVNTSCEVQVIEGTVQSIGLTVKTNWYQGEWQSSLNAEFQLLHKYNQCQISPFLAKELEWSQGNIIKIHHGEQVLFACVDIEKRRDNSSHYINGNLMNLACSEWVNGDLDMNQLTKVSLASEQESQAFISSNEKRLAQAKAVKKSLLSRLQENDQFIPIRLHAGGLNDG